MPGAASIGRSGDSVAGTGIAGLAGGAAGVGTAIASTGIGAFSVACGPSTDTTGSLVGTRSRAGTDCQLTSATAFEITGPSGGSTSESFVLRGRNAALRGLGTGSATTPGIVAPACGCGIAPGVAPLEVYQFTGTFGDLSTQSFYPPHHLTMGEGGAVNIVRDMKLKVLVESFRDWGRDCWCASGKDNTCHKRFGWKLGELPEGYDHKYIYSHLGYNLKPLDPQAAIGREQLKKLPAFVQARIRNWNVLREGLAGLEDFFEFHLPTHATGWSQSGFAWDNSGHRTECSWFGFMMLVKKSAPFSRRDFAVALDAAKIGNRMLFGGNLLRQPAFVQLRKDRPDALRIVGDMAGADRIMNEAIFIGTYPGLSAEMLAYIIATIRDFATKR